MAKALKLWRSTNVPGVVNSYPMGGEWIEMRKATPDELMAAALGRIELYIIVEEEDD